MKSMTGKAWSFTLAGVFVAMGCSSEPPETGGEANTGSGSVGSELKIGRSTQLNTLKYTLIGPNGFSAKGSIDISRSREAFGKVPNVPAGGPYTLSLTAASTDGNVTCTGSKSAIAVTCDRAHDKENVRLTCTRNHLGREWGDRDWRSNGRTFFIGAQIQLTCLVDAGAGAPDAGAPDATRDAVADAVGDGSDSCVPLTACPGLRPCGVISNLCGGALNCGSCPIGSTCSSDHICVGEPDACTARGTTASCVQSMDPPGSNSCSQCLVDNGCLDPAFGGGTCEDVTGTQPHAATSPDGRPCSSVLRTPPTETQICLQTLETIFNSGCAQSGQLVTCLCGSTDPNACVNGQAPPTGPIAAVHVCDEGSPGTIIPASFPQLYGASRAEQIAECSSAFGCHCFDCRPATTCPSGQTCGVAPDGCGGLINCGACPNGLTCGGAGVPGQCGFCPAASCAPGQNCGTASNGCGNTVACGTCTAPQTCGGGGIPGRCGSCAPTLTCPAGACGSVSDGCGGFISCGACGAGQACGSLDRLCHDVAAACSPTGSTPACVATRDKAGQSSCSQCMTDNGCFDAALGGGTCEDVHGTGPHLGGVLPDGRSCAAASSAGPAVLASGAETETQICLQTLGAIFASQCAAPDGTLGPCVCGDIDPAQCLGGAATPVGPVFDTYACDVNSASIGVLVNDVTSPAFGIGMADVLVQCAGAFGCNCF